MPRVKTTAHAAKGAKGGKGKDMQDTSLSADNLSYNSVNSVPTDATLSKKKKSTSGTEEGPHVSFDGKSREATVAYTAKSPYTHKSSSGRANSASRELPRSSKLHSAKDSLNMSSGGGKGKSTPLSARKHVIKTGKRFKPGTQALKEIKRL